MTNADAPALIDRPTPDQLVRLIDDILPQTQCRKCGYDGCRPYAAAIARLNESINRCPPGGTATIARLARLLEQEPLPLDQSRGAPTPPLTAVIREAECIGCTKCIQACPVDAITGAARLMHTVIKSECTGCELCVEPCPVDCIDLVRLDSVTAQPDEQLRQYRRRRFEFRQARLAAGTRESGSRRRSVSTPDPSPTPTRASGEFSRQKAKEEIARAIARVKARRQSEHR